MSDIDFNESGVPFNGRRFAVAHEDGGCCHPVDGRHYPNEPDTCCHVHADKLPMNTRSNTGEPDEPPNNWTAQRQGQEDKLLHDIAETRAALHRHDLRGGHAPA